MKLTAESNGKIADIDHFLDFAEAFLEAFTHFIAYKCAEICFVYAEGVADLADDFPALWRGEMTPNRERRLGGFHHLIVGLGI
jgi:hypothetical protein